MTENFKGCDWRKEAVFSNGGSNQFFLPYENTAVITLPGYCVYCPGAV